MRSRIPSRLLHLSALIIVAALAASAANAPTDLPEATNGIVYSYPLHFQLSFNALTPISASVTAGALPKGLDLKESQITGMPQIDMDQEYNFTVTVTDSSATPQKATFDYHIHGVASAPGSTIVDLPDASNGTAYSYQLGFQLPFQATTPFATKVTTGALPQGLDLKEARISGTPQIKSDQDFPFTVTVTDSSATPQTANFNYRIHGRAAQPNCWTKPEITGRCGGPWLRTIVGFEQAGVSAAQSQQDFFLDIYYDRPLAFKRRTNKQNAKQNQQSTDKQDAKQSQQGTDKQDKEDSDLGSALRSWGDLRISSVPQQINTDVATFAAGFAQQVGQLKVNQVAQAFEFLGGLQYRLAVSGSPNYASTDSAHDTAHARVSANLIMGGGVITPLSPKDSVQIFSVPSNQPSFLKMFPTASGKQFVAFTLMDRDRFFRQAYGGFRLMTHFVGVDPARAPETFDLTYGFNESITGGRIHGGVMRLEGFVPIPYNTLSWIYLFGTGMFKPGAHATIATPFLLDKAPTETLPTNSGAVVIPTRQADRDYYRVGVGIDFVSLVQCFTSSTCKSQKPSGAAPSGK